MKRSLVPKLCCPTCRTSLTLTQARERLGEIEEGELSCEAGHRYPIRRFIPRFVPGDGYVGAFSFEWRIHRQTQLDSARGDRESTTRFQWNLDVPLSSLKHQLVLDAGCGMGRFMEVVADQGAEVIGVDLSFAVDAAFDNLGQRPGVHLIQADLFALPLREAQFDLIYCLGVLQFTPDPRRAFGQLPRLLKPGGAITVTLYSAYQKLFVYNATAWRAITTRLPKRLLYGLCHAAIPLYYLYRIPVLGQALRAIALISMHPEPRWRVLDTFNWYSPRYQSWHTHFEVGRWFQEHGLVDLRILEPAVSLIARRPGGTPALCASEEPCSPSQRMTAADAQ